MASGSEPTSRLPILPSVILIYRLLFLPLASSCSGSSHRLHHTSSMALASPEVKPLDLLRCDRDGCNRWWRRSDLKTLGSDGFQKCPHCREVKTTPTKYWIGGVSGPRETAYDYPARTPPMHPLPLKPPGDRSNSVKRSVPGDSPTATPTPNKKPRTHQYQQQVSVEESVSASGRVC